MDSRQMSLTVNCIISLWKSPFVDRSQPSNLSCTIYNLISGTVCQSWACDYTAATTYSRFQAKQCRLLMYYEYTVFIMASPFRHRGIKIFQIFVCHWSSLTCCRLVVKQKKSPAQLCCLLYYCFPVYCRLMWVPEQNLTWWQKVNTLTQQQQQQQQTLPTEHRRQR